MNRQKWQKDGDIDRMLAAFAIPDRRLRLSPTTGVNQGYTSVDVAEPSKGGWTP